jgi:hypothetical protein
LQVHEITEGGTLPTNRNTIERTMGVGPRVVNGNFLRKSVIEWIVDHRHAFNEIEAESFKNMIVFINKKAIDKLL